MQEQDEDMELGDTGVWYQKNFPQSSATAQVAEQDWYENGYKTVWYNCKNYRANLLLENGKLWFRDLTIFDDRYQERYLHKPCDGWIATYDNLPIVDSRIWSKNGTAGDVVLSESSMDFENCGDLYYSWGIPTEETHLVFAGNCLKGSQRGFAYEMPVIGNVAQDGEGYLWQPENGKLSLQLDVRI